MAIGVHDLGGLREQIIANVTIAFPLVLPHEHVPSPGPAGTKFNIITRFRNNSFTGCDTYEAFCLYGPDNKVFVEGLPCYTGEQSLLNLLETTSAMIGMLYDCGKLELMDGKVKSLCGPGKGAFNLGNLGHVA